MKKYWAQYRNQLNTSLDALFRHNENAIQQASGFLAEAIKKDQLIHIIGSGGHSTLGAMELFWRAGSLAPVNPLLDPALLLSQGALHSNMMERTEGLAKTILDSYGVAEGEVIIIVNAYGINAVTIDTALEAKKRGLKTIAVTTTSFAENVPPGTKSRHSSGKSLHELVDIFIDNFMPYGDAVVEIEKVEQKVAPVSTIMNSVCLHLLLIDTVERLQSQGIEPPVWMSANLPEGDAANKRWHEKYNHRIKHLR